MTYTFTATNNGTAADRPAPTARPTNGPGLGDGPALHAPATYQSGDTDGNDLLDAGETWIFTCGRRDRDHAQRRRSLANRPRPTVRRCRCRPSPTSPPRWSVDQPGARRHQDGAGPGRARPGRAPSTVRTPPTRARPSTATRSPTPGDVPLEPCRHPPADDKCAPLTSSRATRTATACSTRARCGSTRAAPRWSARTRIRHRATCPPDVDNTVDVGRRPVLRRRSGARQAGDRHRHRDGPRSSSRPGAHQVRLRAGGPQRREGHLHGTVANTGTSDSS